MTSLPRRRDVEGRSARTRPSLCRGGTGVVVIYQDYAPIARAANAAFLPVAGIFEAVLLLLFVALVPILRRVTQRIRRQMDEIEHRAHYDELTGLPNRTLFRSLPGRARACRSDGTAAVLLLDVDHFKEVNDALGHERGDSCCCRIGERLHALCDGRDVARLGGDEFAILLPRRVGDGDGVRRPHPRGARAAVRARTASRSRWPRASASPSSASTGRTSTRSSSTPTSRCTSPRARTPARPSTTRAGHERRRAARARRRAAPRDSSRRSSSSTTSRRPTSRPAGSSASRRSSAGAPRARASSRPTSSSASPSAPA